MWKDPAENDESTPTTQPNEWGIINYISGFWHGQQQPTEKEPKKLEKSFSFENTPKPGILSRGIRSQDPIRSPRESDDPIESPSTPTGSTSKFQVSVVFDDKFDEDKLQQTITMVQKSLNLKGSDHIGTYSPKGTPKGLETPKKNVLLDNIKPMSTPILKSPLHISTLKDLDCVGETKVNNFRTILLEDDIELDRLSKLGWSGIPQEFRSQTWKLLTGYLSCSKSRREGALLRKRKEYFDSVDKYLDESVRKSNAENGQWVQIRKDSTRTSPEIFRQVRLQHALERMLYIWALRHPASGYVQGLNDILTPFLLVFISDHVDDAFTCDTSKIDDQVFKDIEADAYWCFTLFVNFIQDHYTFAQPGIQRMVQKLEDLIAKIDPELYQHMMDEKLDFMPFSLRWMNCLLMREIPVKLSIRLFDTYISEGTCFASLHTYVCVAFLKTWSSRLVKMDNAEMMMFLLNELPTKEWSFNEIELLLSQAYMLKSLYENERV